MKLLTIRQVSSMIHSARPIVTPVANIVFCCLVFLDLKSGDGRTDNMCENNGRDFGLAEWINNIYLYYIPVLYCVRSVLN